MRRGGRRYLIPITLLAALLCVLLEANNPAPSAYAKILARDMNQHQPPSFAKALTKFFSPLVASYINRESTRQNWLLFSVYTTSLPNGTTLKMLAIWGVLLPLSGVPKSS